MNAQSIEDLMPIANAIGEAWTHEIVGGLISDEREVIGAWPGTMSEARMRVLARLQTKLDATLLDDLARVANLAARRVWRELSEADPES